MDAPTTGYAFVDEERRVRRQATAPRHGLPPQTARGSAASREGLGELTAAAGLRLEKMTR